jgi:ParB/Sulfiredoxin domain
MSGEDRSWSTWLRVHPTAELSPCMTPAEIAELAADIREHGLRVPMVVLPVAGGVLLLDGRARLRAIEGVLGWEIKPEFFYDAPADMGDPAAYIRSLNWHRRHLFVPARITATPALVRRLDAAMAIVRSHPEHSDRSLSVEFSLSRQTFARARRALAENPGPGQGGGPVEGASSTRLGRDGRTRRLPAKRGEREPRPA